MKTVTKQLQGLIQATIYDNVWSTERSVHADSSKGPSWHLISC